MISNHIKKWKKGAMLLNGFNSQVSNKIEHV